MAKGGRPKLCTECNKEIPTWININFYCPPEYIFMPFCSKNCYDVYLLSWRNGKVTCSLCLKKFNINHYGKCFFSEKHPSISKRIWLNADAFACPNCLDAFKQWSDEKENQEMLETISFY